MDRRFDDLCDRRRTRAIAFKAIRKWDRVVALASKCATSKISPMSSYGGKDRELVSADNLSRQDGVEPCLAQIARAGRGPASDGQLLGALYVP